MVQLPVASRHHESAAGSAAPPPQVAPRNRDLSDRLQAVLTRLGVQTKELAFWWDCSHQFASMVLAGDKPLTDERIEQLPEPVRLALVEEWARDLGLLTGPRAAAIGALEAARALLSLEAVPLRMASAAMEAAPAVPVQTRRRA